LKHLRNTHQFLRIKLPQKSCHKSFNPHFLSNLKQTIKPFHVLLITFSLFYLVFSLVSCCTNKTVINFSTSGLLAVRQDEIMILLELNDDMKGLPKEVFLHLNEIYSKADKSNVIIKEYGYSQAISNNFLGAFGGKIN